jgi:2-polyprenyl-3-methyl-5-hydroxy-6-metoxy-1,4-benzoquinol methylase
MMSILKKLFYNKLMARWLIKPVLSLHSKLYFIAGRLATLLEPKNLHPKHRILGYKEWFLDQIKSKDTVLDVGCNTGSLCELLATKAEQVYGIDIDPRLITIAKSERAKDNITYLIGDATHYDYSNINPIDCVVLSNVLEHIIDRVKFLSSINNSLKWHQPKDKRLLIRVPMLQREWLVIYKREKGLSYMLDPTHDTEYSLGQLKEEVSQAGFEIVKHEVRFGEIYAICRGI